MATKKTTETTEETINISDKKNTKTISIKPLNVKTVEIVIEGDSDLILNKMTDSSITEIVEKQTGKTGKKAKEAINQWQRLLEGIHWMDGKETDFTEDGWKNALSNNRIGYDASGIKKGICDAAVRVLGESKSTITNANIQVLPEKANLIPILFTEVGIDESVITNYKGNAFVTYRNVFSGWSAKFRIQFMADNISVEQLIELVQAMGFAGGLGAHRVGLKGGTNGQFHVASVKYV
jgi:hypothetical protein